MARSLSLATARDSDLAISVLGQRQGKSTWNGYLISARDVLAGVRSSAGPVFYVGQLNPSNRPLLYANSVEGSVYLQGPGGVNAPYPPPFNNQMFGNDFIGVTITPNRTPW